MGGAIQEVYHRIFFISIAFILHFVKSKYRCDNIRKRRIFKIRWRVMLHNQVAINVSTSIQDKGTTKSNAQLNFFSTNLMVRVNIDLMCKKWRAKKNKLQSDGTWTTSCQYKYTDKGQEVLTRTMQNWTFLLALDIFYTNELLIHIR